MTCGAKRVIGRLTGSSEDQICLSDVDARHVAVAPELAGLGLARHADARPQLRLARSRARLHDY